MESPIYLLAAVQIEALGRYREGLSKDPAIKATVVTSEEKARAALADSNRRIDAFVVDNNLCDVYEWVKELRVSHPRMMIIIVDEEADFLSPGRADEVSTEPFKEGDLIRKIKRLNEERSLPTLSADSLPAVRNFAKTLRKASKITGKQEATVAAVHELGFDHVVYYSVVPGDPPSLSLSAQVGNATGQLPIRTEYAGILGHIAQKGQSAIVGPGDKPSHVLVERGQYGAAVGIAVGSTLRFGVLIAFKHEAGSIKPDDIVLLELMGAQLAAAIAKEQRS